MTSIKTYIEFVPNYINSVWRKELDYFYAGSTGKCKISDLFEELGFRV